MPSAPDRRRRHARWITARKVVQYLALAAFLIATIGSGRAGWAGAFSTRIMQLDPLTSLASALGGRTLFDGIALALILILLTLLFGRAWCGWLCPLGTVLDLFSLRRMRGERKAPSESWRGVKYALLILILFGALFANLTLMILDPLTLMLRTVGSAAMPALDTGITALEFALYRIPILRAGVGSVDGLLRPALLPQTPVISRAALLYASAFLAVILLNALAERFWCRYLCPMGGLLGLLAKAALVQRQVGAECKGCLRCEPACPTGTIQGERGYGSDPGECTLCLECLPACPKKAVTFPLRLGIGEWRSYDPGRRAALLSLGGAAAGVALLRAGGSEYGRDPHWIIPPGAEEDTFLSRCVRCGACLAACPTGGLQPSIREAGLEGLWTPVLVPRLGYCHYACNACGSACPLGAIAPLELEAKQATVIGRAYIDRDRCIAWAEGTDCIVCEEMCPLPEKAITLENDPQDRSAALRPHVIAERCIGCGICEYKCPVSGPAAIRVSNPNAADILTIGI
jgi:polyferredoxin